MENVLIGLVLLNEVNEREITNYVSPIMLKDPKNRFIYNELLKAKNEGEKTGAVELIAYMKNRGSEHPEIINHMLDMVEGVSDTIDVGYYVDEVINLHIRDELVKIENYAGMTTTQIEMSVIDKVKKLEALKRPKTLEFCGHKGRDYRDRVIAEAISGEQPEKFKTRFEKINSSMNGGFRGGRFYIIGARSGTGKTALLMNLMEDFANGKAKTLFVSYEMPEELIFERYLTQVSGIGSYKIMSRCLSPLEQQALHKEELKFFDNLAIIDDNYTIEELETQITAMHKLQGLKIVCVDYFQKIGSKKAFSNEMDKEKYISGKLTWLAKELGIVVILLSQLNKSGGQDGIKVNALKGTSQLENDAHYIALMTTLEHNKNTSVSIINFDIIKNREGRLDEINLNFYGKRVSFEEL